MLHIQIKQGKLHDEGYVENDVEWKKLNTTQHYRMSPKDNSHRMFLDDVVVAPNYTVTGEFSEIII